MNTTQMFVFIIVGFICLAGVTGYLIVQSSDFSSRIDLLETVLGNEELSHNQTKENLTSAQNQLTVVQNQLTNTQVELSTVTNKFNTISTLYGTLFTNYNISIANITSLQTQLNASTVPNYYHLHDPTYAEMISFLENDTTDNQTYNQTYNSSYYAQNVKNNAQEKGIRCSIVMLYFNETDLTYSMNGFNTTTNGFVFIEPQKDEIKQNISISKIYWGYTIRDVLTIW